MARSVLVSDLMAGARSRANDVTGALADDPTLISFINQAYGLYYDTLVRADPAFYQAEASFATVNGTKAYSLPTGWISTLHVGRLSGAKYQRLSRLNADEAFDYGVNGTPIKFQPEAGQLALYPTPAGVYTIKHLYVPAWTKLTSGAQEIDGLLGNEDLIESHVGVRLCKIDEVDPIDCITERDAALARLAQQAFQRSVIDAQVAGEKLIDEGPYFGGRDRDYLFE